MQTLPIADIKNITASGVAMLECNTLDDFQCKTIHQLQEIIGADSGVYYEIRNENWKLKFTNGYSIGVPSQAPKIWRDNYQDRDPFVTNAIHHIGRGLSNTVVSNEVVNHQEYINSEFYCDFLHPQSIYHVMVIALVKKTIPVALIGLHRPAGSPAFSQKDVVKADMITPYFAAALEKIKLNHQLNERQRVIDTLVSELPYQGVIVLDKDLTPIVINEQINKLIDFSSAPAAPANKASALIPETIIACCNHWKTLCRSPQRTALPEKINFRFDHNGKPVSGYVRALENESNEIFYIICLGNDDFNALNSGSFSRYGLTRREIDIIHLVSTGMTNPEIAAKLFISKRTVQNHLRSIFSKVGVHNRTSLISSLLLEN